MWDYGEKLAIGIMDISKELGLEDSFSIVGPSISQNFLTKDLDGNISLPLRTLFSQEMIKNGVILSWIATSLSHKDKELEITFEAARKSLIKYSEALNNGVENYLIGDVVKPVFRKHN
jgi:glutamate-1-semialdehyde 2,1-aminomutase